MVFSFTEKTNILSVHFISWSKCGKIQADVWFDISKSFPWGLGTNQKIHSWIEHFLTIREVFFVHFSEMFSRHCNWESSTRYSCALTHSNSTMLWQQLRSFRQAMLANMGPFKNYVDPIWSNLDLLPLKWTKLSMRIHQKFRKKVSTRIYCPWEVSIPQN